MIQVLAIFILLASLLGLLSPLITPVFNGQVPQLAWLFDLASHWQGLYALLLILSLVGLVPKHKSWLFTLCALALPLISASPQLPKASGSNQLLKILSSNVYVGNSNLSTLKALIDQEKPDIIVLLEFTPAHQQQVATWTDYPQQFLNPKSQHNAFGMAILSRLALSNQHIITDGHGIEHLVTQVAYQNQSIKLIGFHPLPPINQTAHVIRDQVLQDLTQSSEQPTLIVGDFNASPWSSAFKGLAAKGFYRTLNLWPTWPAKGKGLFGIPIDQVLASKQWHKIDTKIADSIGSDHYPIVVELSL